MKACWLEWNIKGNRGGSTWYAFAFIYLGCNIWIAKISWTAIYCKRSSKKWSSESSAGRHKYQTTECRCFEIHALSVTCAYVWNTPELDAIVICWILFYGKMATFYYRVPIWCHMVKYYNNYNNWIVHAQFGSRSDRLWHPNPLTKQVSQ